MLIREKDLDKIFKHNIKISVLIFSTDNLKLLLKLSFIQNKQIKDI